MKLFFCPLCPMNVEYAVRYGGADTNMTQDVVMIIAEKRSKKMQPKFGGITDGN